MRPFSLTTNASRRRNERNCRRAYVPAKLYVCTEMSTCLTLRETNRGKQTLRVNSLACHSASFSLIFSSTLSLFFAILHRSYLPPVFLLSVTRRFRFTALHRPHSRAPFPIFFSFSSLIHNENYSESVNACRDNRIYRPRQ